MTVLLPAMPAHEARAFTLERKTLPRGATRSHEKRVALTGLLVGGGILTPRSLELASRSEVSWREEVLEVDGAGFPRLVECVFLHSLANDPLAVASSFLPDALSGRRFRVTAGEPSRVEPTDGAALQAGLAARVRRDVRGLGEPPLFWVFCPSGEVGPNTPMPLDQASAAAWFGHDPAFVVENASATYLGLADLQDTEPRRVALFSGAVSFRGSPSSAFALQSALTGWIGVDPATGERVAAELSGPVQLEVTAQALGLSHPMSGQGTLSISTRTRLSVASMEGA